MYKEKHVLHKPRAVSNPGGTVGHGMADRGRLGAYRRQDDVVRCCEGSYHLPNLERKARGGQQK
jgi:hypothetical protein